MTLFVPSESTAVFEGGAALIALEDNVRSRMLAKLGAIKRDKLALVAFVLDVVYVFHVLLQVVFCPARVEIPRIAVNFVWDAVIAWRKFCGKLAQGALKGV